MAQGKMKKTTTLPKGVKQKVKKEKSKGPKRGQMIHFAAKRQSVLEQQKVVAEVSKIINDKNEEMVKNRANNSQGRTSKK